MLRTMPDASWHVHVGDWTWIYTFNRKGGVSWRDPVNGLHGSGTWRIEKDWLVTTWFHSTTREEWKLPVAAYMTGTCHMGDDDYYLWAESPDFILKPGDVVYTPERKYVIYDDEIRTGGSVAWICRNPGNIREGEKYGSIPGKRFDTGKVGLFSIFPTEAVGYEAIKKVLRGYGGMSILDIMKKYAPEKDGNNPVAYAQGVARDVGVSIDTPANTLDDGQIETFAAAIKRIEGWIEGTRLSRDDPSLPEDVAARFARLSPPTDDEIRNSSLLMSW